MKFSINRELLLYNLNQVTKALSTKPQMPILTGIKIDVKKDCLNLTASNGEISIQTTIKDKDQLIIDQEGVCVVPGRYFQEIAKRVESKMIDVISFEDNMIKILADRSNFTLNLMEKENFPMISFDETDTFINLDVINLKQIIKKTTFATSMSEARMVLTGVSFATSDKKVEVIATDSFRLARKYMIFDDLTTKISVVIPSKSLDELNKVIDETNESVNIYFSKTKALFKYKNLLFQTRLIEGVYPNTSSLIPNDFITSIKFNKHELLSTIDRASLFSSSETTNIIKLNLTTDRVVEISSITNEIGGVIEEIYPLDCTKVMPFQIAFSSKYFLDAIKSFESPEITIHFTGEIKPFIITGEYDVNHLQLILPVRVA